MLLHVYYCNAEKTFLRHVTKIREQNIPHEKAIQKLRIIISLHLLITRNSNNQQFTLTLNFMRLNNCNNYNQLNDNGL
ncbi:hypothetical protein T07_1612 [Trichinella nelsoni]|uniref:Uncharacterized protein n=1 Tax=Trichinella nelsoni TaxID=6336 RepID=A0A0V0SHA5_9BILA|nr:hypothetical protein T07_1612 [Trichinella nelsoni]